MVMMECSAEIQTGDAAQIHSDKPSFWNFLKGEPNYATATYERQN